MKMIKNAPVKFRILEMYEERGPMWNYEVIPMVMDEYHMRSTHE